MCDALRGVWLVGDMAILTFSQTHAMQCGVLLPAVCVAAGLPASRRPGGWFHTVIAAAALEGAHMYTASHVKQGVSASVACVRCTALTLLRIMCCCSLHGYDLLGLFASNVQHHETLSVVAKRDSCTQLLRRESYVSGADSIRYQHLLRRLGR
jgi:hypothetical protein